MVPLFVPRRILETQQALVGKRESDRFTTARSASHRVAMIKSCDAQEPTAGRPDGLAALRSVSASVRSRVEKSAARRRPAAASLGPSASRRPAPRPSPLRSRTALCYAGVQHVYRTRVPGRIPSDGSTWRAPIGLLVLSMQHVHRIVGLGEAPPVRHASGAGSKV